MMLLLLLVLLTPIGSLNQIQIKCQINYSRFRDVPTRYPPHLYDPLQKCSNILYKNVQNQDLLTYDIFVCHVLVSQYLLHIQLNAIVGLLQLSI